MNGLGWYLEFLLKIDLEFVLTKRRARLNSMIDLKSLHIIPEVRQRFGLFGTLSNVGYIV